MKKIVEDILLSMYEEGDTPAERITYQVGDHLLQVIQHKDGSTPLVYFDGKMALVPREDVERLREGLDSGALSLAGYG